MTAPTAPFSGRGRPMGEVAQVLMREAMVNPGTVRDLAQRAQVGYGVARYTATRLVDRGQLEVKSEGRPMVLGARAAGLGAVQADVSACGLHLQMLPRSFWDDAACDGASVASADALDAFACL